MNDFTPLSALAGGVLIGLAAAGLLLVNGRIAGISGMLAGAISPNTTDKGWRRAFLAGLVGGGVLAALLLPGAFGPALLGPGALVAAGAVVGLGTRLGGGCTSGHGVCGIGRMSKRSMVAVATFMATGAVAVYVARVLA